MTAVSRKSLLAMFICLSALLMATDAHAFRCKNKLVKDGMHEQQVIAICGQPTTMRHLGWALRSFPITSRDRYPGGFTNGASYPGVGITQEVIITEYVYNFGPRKLMRRLVFEGGVLVTIETIGYGYIEK